MENKQNESKDNSVTDNANDNLKMGDWYSKVGLNTLPSCGAPEGIWFDFCWGMRVFIPDSPMRKYRVQYWDMDDGSICLDSVVDKSSLIQGNRHYYRPYYLKISDAVTGESVFEHKMDLMDKQVLMYFPVDTVGDTLSWFRAVEIFTRIHKCNTVVAVAPHMRELLEKAHPDMAFVERNEVRTLHPYASYLFGVDFNGDEYSQNNDFRTEPLAWHACDMLGIDPHFAREIPPKIYYNTEAPRKIAEHYVCISSMASGGCKLWLNPNGWPKVIEFLKSKGYRVIDIDGQRCVGSGFTYQFIPRDAEDWTGKGDGKSLVDRAELISNCDFFIGLGSGLSWLAWAVGKPVVLISGFSSHWCEFYTPYRVQNTKVCHSCFNDVRYSFDATDCFWCPVHRGTRRQLECSVKITPELVINTIRRMPEFMSHEEYMKDIEEQVIKSDETDDGTINDGNGYGLSSVDGMKEEWKVKDGSIVDACGFSSSSSCVDGEDGKLRGISVCFGSGGNVMMPEGSEAAAAFMRGIQGRLDAFDDDSSNVDESSSSAECEKDV